jgi:hypothetical protein
MGKILKSVFLKGTGFKCTALAGTGITMIIG